MSFFYFNRKQIGTVGDEFFGIAAGRLYLGYYGSKRAWKLFTRQVGFVGSPERVAYGWCCGILDKTGILIDRLSISRQQIQNRFRRGS